MDAMTFIGPTVGGSMLIYAVYCMSAGGTHVKGRGWMTKEEAPKSYIFNQALYLLLGISFAFSLWYRK